MAEEQLGADLISKELLDRFQALIKLSKEFTVETTKQVNELLKAQKSFDQTAKSQKELSDREKEAIQIEKNLQKAEKLQRGELDELTKSKIKLQKATKETNDRLKQQMGITQQNTGFMNKMTSAVQSGIAKFTLIAGAVGGAILGLKKFGKAVIESSDALKDDWEVATSQASAAFDVFKKSIATMDFSNFFRNMREAISLAEDYTRGMQQIEDLTRSLNIQEVKQQGELARLKKVYMDATLSIDDRKRALEEYKAIILDLGTKQTDYTKKTYDLEVKTAAQRTGLTEEQIIQFIELNDKMSDLNKAALELQENQVNAFSPMGAWRLVMKGLTGDMKETSDANQKLIDTLVSSGMQGQEAMDFATKIRKLGVEDLKKLEEAAKASYAAQNKFDEETVRQEAVLNRLDNTTNKLIATEKARTEATKAAIEGITLKRIESEKIWTGEKNTETDFEINLNDEMNRRRLENDKEYNENSAAAYARRIQEQIEEEERGAQIIADLRKNLSEQVEESAKQIALDQITATIDEKAAKTEAGFKAEEERLKFKLDKGLITEQEYQERFKLIQKKARESAAKAEKKKALWSIAIDTIVNSVKALGTPPVPNFIASALTAGIGAAQAIAVGAKPTAFKEGTKGRRLAKDTYSLIGDGGKRELVLTPKGGFLSYPFPTETILPKGSQVLSGEETEKLAATLDFKELIQEQRLTRKAIGNHTNIDKHGVNEIVKANNAHTIYKKRFL